MLATGQHGWRCCSCALRTRQITLQQIRTRSASVRKPSRPNSHPSRPDIPGSGHFIRFRTRGIDNREAESKGGPRLRRVRPYSEVLAVQLQAVKEELRNSPILEQLRKDGDDTSFDEIWTKLEIQCRTDRYRADSADTFGALPSVAVGADLKATFRKRGESALAQRIKYHFYGQAVAHRFSPTDLKNQSQLADLRFPAEWYPGTRTVPRQVHLHVGPTNSGKTYQALKRLEEAESGLYAGPLRLLAHEVFSRMNAKGIPCALITGEERRAASPASPGVDENQRVPANVIACTVEMTPLNRHFEVAVIDEIQMIGNKDRGWAWTGALLGVLAGELHLCGEERTVPLIQQICATLGDEVTVHRYERLAPLRAEERSLGGDLDKLRKGDCVVSFSVVSIHALRQQIERKTGKKVATVYGGLPPETRAQQARLFNEPDNDYDFLVASDAVGMGLNLAIRRVVFETVAKFDGHVYRVLPVAEIKQIAGRAGRYRVALQQDQPRAGEEAQQDERVGLVTTLEDDDLPIVQQALESEPDPILSAGIQPPGPILERFSQYFPPGTPLSYIMTRLHEQSQTNARFHLCNLKENVWVTDLIEPVKGLTVIERYVLSSSPANSRDQISDKLLPALARNIADQVEGNILDYPELPLEILDQETSADRPYLRELERLHKGLTTYLWVSFRFPGVFPTRALAQHIKSITEQKIEAALSQMSFSEKKRRQLAEFKRQQAASEVIADWSSDDEGDPVDRIGDVLHLPAHEQDSQDSPIGSGDRVEGGDDVPYEEPPPAEFEQHQTAESPSEQVDGSLAPWAVIPKVSRQPGLSAPEPQHRADSGPAGQR